MSISDLALLVLAITVLIQQALIYGLNRRLYFLERNFCHLDHLFSGRPIKLRQPTA